MINVPYFKSVGKNNCGPACLRMILSYWGQDVTEEEITGLLPSSLKGTFLTDLGKVAINLGLNTEAFTYNLSLINPLQVPFGTNINRLFLDRVKPRKTDKEIIASWDRYVSVGGKLIWDYPRMEILEMITRQGWPGLVSVNPAALNRQVKSVYVGHDLVITGVNSKQIYVLDPAGGKTGGRYAIDRDLFLAAWIARARSTSGYLIVIKSQIFFN